MPQAKSTTVDGFRARDLGAVALMVMAALMAVAWLWLGRVQVHYAFEMAKGNANTLRMALEQFSMDHGGRFPKDAADLKLKLWGPHSVYFRRDAAPRVWDARPGGSGVILGPVTRSPGRFPTRQTDPGALGYLHDPASETYAVFITRDEGGQAVQR